MRLGLRDGCASSTVLYLPFLDGDTADRSVSAKTATRSGEVRWTSGPHGDAMIFRGDVANISQLTYAMPASVSGALTVDAWVRSYDGTPASVVCAAQTGGQNNCFRMVCYWDYCNFTIWDSGGISDTVSSTLQRGQAQSVQVYANSYPRWQHVRCVYSPGVGLYVFMDGRLVGYKATARADLQTASLGPVQVGTEDSLASPGGAVGIVEMADVRIRSVADTDASTCAINLQHSRVTRRRFRVYNLDLREDLSNYSWTADGSGGYWLALSAITSGSFVIRPDDVISVKYKTQTASTTYTAVGNVTDLDAASNSYFVDAINSRLYSSEDPSTATVFEVTIRAPLSSHGMRRGWRYYYPIIDGVASLARMFPYLDQPYQLGGGGSLKVAMESSAIPDGLFVEQNNMLWTGSAMSAATMSDGMRWRSSITDFIGVVTQQPDVTPDVATISLAHEPARLARAVVQKAIANQEDYPRLYEGAQGYVWPTLLGRGLKRVPTKCIDTQIATTIGYKRKVCDHAISRIFASGIGVNQHTKLYLYNIDLSDGTFYSPYAPAVELWVSVDGLGTPASPTSTPGVLINDPFGDAADCVTGAVALIQHLLTDFLGIPTAQIGTSFAATAARVAVWLRSDTQLANAGDGIALLRRWLFQSMTNLYFVPSTGLWELEDVNKADASQWTIRDADVVSEQWVYDRNRLAQVANASAWEYVLDQDGSMTKGRATTLALDTSPRYDAKDTWAPDGGLTGHYTKNTLDTWLAVVQPFLERPATFYHVTLPMRFARMELFDVVTVASSTLPAISSSRFRVYEMSSGDGATVTARMFSEVQFPADGTSVTASREGLSPTCRLRWGKIAGQACNTAGAWTRVDSIEHLVQGVNLYPSDVTHRFAVQAVRSGGAADTDFKVRIYDVRNALAVATISQGFGTTKEIEVTTSFANIPTNLADCEVQYYASGGATGTVYAYSWEDKEGTTNGVGEPMSPTMLMQAATPAGVTCATPSSAGVYIAFDKYIGIWGPLWNFPIGGRIRFAVHLDAGTATGLEIVVSSPNGAGTPRTVASIPAPSTGYSSVICDTIVTPTSPSFSLAGCSAYYKITGGSCTVYSVSAEILNPLPDA